MDVLDKILEAYKEETKTPLSLDEIKECVQFWQPLINNYGTVGLFGFDVISSEVYGSQAIIKMIYMFPEHRVTFKPVAVGILKHFKGLGINNIEIQSNGKIHNWMRKHLNSKPIIYIHQLDVEKSLGTLGG